MSITFPIDLPSKPGFLSQEWDYKVIAAVSRSIFTGSIQVQKFQGEWLESTVVLPAMPRELAEQWAAFLALLRGPVNSFLLGDSLSNVHGTLGVATGTPLIKGAGQIGSLVHTDGWTHDIAKIVKAGDFLSFGVAKEHLYKATADSDSDSSGNADINIFPSILEATTDDDEITIPGMGQFKLLDAGKYAYGVDQICKGLTFTCAQDISS